MTTAPANPDAALMHGDPTNPQGGIPTKPTTPEMVEIKIGDTTVKVDKATAEAIRVANEAASDAIERAREEGAASARAKPAAKTNSADGADPFENLDVELFADPKGTLRKVVDYAVGITTKDLTARYEAEQNRSAFWSEFYSENKDLAGERMLVNAVFQRDLPKLSPMKASVAAVSLAKAAKAELLRLKGDSGGTKPAKPAAEGGNESGNLSKSQQSKPSDAKQAPKSLSATIRERQARRAAASRGEQRTAE